MSVAREDGALAAVSRWLLGRRRGSRGYVTYSSGSRRRWWGVPKRLWLVVWRRRLINLAPIHYLIVLAFGLLVGVVLQLTLGVWWWMPPLILLAALGLFETTSALWPRPWRGHPHPDPHSLRIALLTAIDAKRGVEASRRAERAMLLGSGLPFFAPAAPGMYISFGGWASGPEGLASASIAARPADQEPPQGPLVTLMTQRRADPESESEGESEEKALRRRTAHGLGGRLAMDARGSGAAREHMADDRLRARERAEALEWHPAAIVIDGAAVEGWGTEVGGFAARYAAVGGFWLSILGEATAVAGPVRRIADPGEIAGF
jgi:hypothetical protein